ncbi:DUF3833 family protein [Sphingomicrobium sp. XHP0239]|uniref:DUF3833 family protein n=1 Tax=Sphingomicrobium maritimum TaxID=3133972 RepID=UPI0031CC7455
MRLAAIPLAFALAACLPAVDLPEEAETPRLDPIAFFEGQTEGSGTLVLVTGKTHRIDVESEGTLRPDGSLELVQRISEGDKPARTRTWIMTDEGDGRYGGSLTDAVGEVEAYTDGNRMTIRYETEGERIEQTLALEPDGTTVRNRLDAYKWGLNVARLDETIVKQ